LKDMFDALAAQKGLALDVTVDPHAPAAIRSDPLRLQQVLRNLLSNAVKFTQHGKVSVSVTPRGPRRVRFAVADTGIGIPPDQHDAIFDAFHQADAGTHRRYGGSGLGLTISRELARRLGGSLSLQSEPGKGST